MNKIGRRSFLQALGAAPVVAPLALKKATEDATAQFANLSVNGISGNGCAPYPSQGEEFHKKARQAVILGGKKRILEQLYEEQACVSRFDFDIAVMKAPSLDRIDNDGNYDYKNCRFIENEENARRCHEKT